MDNTDKIISIFCDEAFEHIEVINNALLEIEKAESAEEVEENIFTELMRSAHSLKGAARMTNLKNVASASHYLESIVLGISNGKLPHQKTLIDMLFEAIDEIKNTIELFKESGDVSADNNIDILLTKLELFTDDTLDESDDHQATPTQKTESDSAPVKQETSTPAPETPSEPPKKEETSPASTSQPEAPAAPKKDIPPPPKVKREEYAPWNPQDYEFVLEDFLLEADECLEKINTNIIKLEEEKSIEILNEIFRAAHTLKGNSGTVNLHAVQNLTHSIENIFDDLRNDKYDVTQELIDVLLKCLDVLGAIFAKVHSMEIIEVDVNELIELLALTKHNMMHGVSGSTGGSTPAVASVSEASDKPDVKDDIKAKMDKLKIVQATDAGKKKSAQPSKIVQKQTIRVDSQKLDNILNLVGELVINKISLDEQLSKLNTLLLELEKNRKQMHMLNFENLSEKKSFFSNFFRDIKKTVVDSFLMDDEEEEEEEQDKCTVVIKALERLFEKQTQLKQVEDEAISNMSDEIKVISKSMTSISSASNEVVLGLVDSTDQVGFITKELQNEVMKTRMVPIGNTFNKFPRTVRDLSHALNKQIKLEIYGEDTELDKNVIDKMGDPLMHLIRNSIDHGVEMPDKRAAAGKPEQGIIKLSAYYRGNQVIIEIEDDGGGINAEKVKAKAIDRGIITEEEAEQLPKKQIFNFIMAPGFSTAEKVTDVSGRGVGMDVVNDTISQLKGMIDVDSKEGEFTRFTIKLPLTVAIIQVLLVKVEDEAFAIPIFNIEETLKILPDQIKKVGVKDVINIRGKVVPVVNTADVLELPETSEEKPDDDFICICVVGLAEKRIGLVIDDLLGNQEVVIKNLGTYFQKIKHVAGATILGSGKIMLIVDVPSLMKDICEGDTITSSIRSKKSVSHTETVSKPKESADKTEPDSEKPKPKAAKKSGPKNVLIVEDSKSVRTIIKSYIQEAGFKVDEAIDGYEGLQKAKEKKYDLVCTDISMPRMDGYTLTKNLRKLEQYKLSPIIIVSSHDREVDKLKGFDAGADDYILKPLDKEHFLSNLKKFINK